MTSHEFGNYIYHEKTKNEKYVYIDKSGINNFLFSSYWLNESERSREKCWSPIFSIIEKDVKKIDVVSFSQQWKILVSH